MTQSPIPKLVSTLALPTIASQMVTAMYNMADTYFVSQIGQSASAAIGVVFSLMSLIQAVGVGVGAGVGGIAALCLGAKKEDDANLYASSGAVLALALGLLLTISGLLLLDSLVIVLGSTETMIPYSRAYAGYVLLGAPAICVSFVFNNALRYQGKAYLAMIGLCVGAILNVVLDPILIYTANMGIAGAAIATVVSQVISALILICAVSSQHSIIRVSPKLISKKPADYLLIVKTGLPASCRQGLACIGSALLNYNTKIYGDAALAAITIANKLYLFVRSFILGIGQGMQPVASYNYGAGNIKRTREAFSFACKLGTGICLIMTAVFALNAPEIMDIFRKGDAEVIELGVTALHFVCAAMPFLAYSTYIGLFLQCLGFSAPAILLSCFRQGIVFIPMLFILKGIFSKLGVQMVQPISDIITFFTSLPFGISFFKSKLSMKSDRKT